MSSISAVRQQRSVGRCSFLPAGAWHSKPISAPCTWSHKEPGSSPPLQARAARRPLQSCAMIATHCLITPPQNGSGTSTPYFSALQMITTGPRHLTHPINRKAKMWVYLRELQEQEGLSEEAVQHIARVAGCR